jgi:hypothetical protein
MRVVQNVVVQQGGGMQHLHSGPQREKSVIVAAESPADKQGKKGPQPLPSRTQHMGSHWARGNGQFADVAIKSGVYPGLFQSEKLVEFLHGVSVWR